MSTMKNKGKAEIVRAATIIRSDANTRTVRASVESVFPNRPEEPSRSQTLKLVEHSGTLDFWEHEDEDIYSLDDGEQL